MLVSSAEIKIKIKSNQIKCTSISRFQPEAVNGCNLSRSYLPEANGNAVVSPCRPTWARIPRQRKCAVPLRSNLGVEFMERKFRAFLCVCRDYQLCSVRMSGCWQTNVNTASVALNAFFLCQLRYYHHCRHWFSMPSTQVRF
jgi:hypothetical protein